MKKHLRAIDRKHHSLIRREIEKRLRRDSGIESRNRKPLRRPGVLEATWECRFGPRNRFRVFYDLDRRRNAVMILAIGEKIDSELRVGGKRFEL